jgi:hypothetical protein
MQHSEHGESFKSRILHLYGEETEDIFDYSRNSASSMKMEQTDCSETSPHKIQTPGNYPEESIKHSEHGESLKSRIHHLYGEETARHIRLFEKLRIIYEDGTDRLFRNVAI